MTDLNDSLTEDQINEENELSKSPAGDFSPNATITEENEINGVLTTNEKSKIVSARVRKFSASNIVTPDKDNSRRNSAKDEIRLARAKKSPRAMSESAMNGTDVSESEYRLQFQNLEQKREIRFLTKTIEEMQGQIANYKKRVKQLNDTMDIKIKNGEEVIDKDGKKFVFLSIENEKALKADIKKFENAWKKSCQDIEQMKKSIESLNTELVQTKKKLNDEKEAGNEKSKLAGNLKKQIETLEKLLEETEAEMKKQQAKSETNINDLSNELIEANENNDTLRKDKLKMEEELDMKKQENEKLLTSNIDLENIIEGKRNQVTKISSELDDVKKQNDVINESLKKETKEKEEYKKWLVDLKVREEKMIEEKDKSIRDKQKEIRYKGEQEKRMKERIKKLEKDVERLTPKARWR